MTHKRGSISYKYRHTNPRMRRVLYRPYAANSYLITHKIVVPYYSKDIHPQKLLERGYVLVSRSASRSQFIYERYV